MKKKENAKQQERIAIIQAVARNKRKKEERKLKQEKKEYDAALKSVMKLRPRVADLIELANQIFACGLEFPESKDLGDVSLCFYMNMTVPKKHKKQKISHVGMHRSSDYDSVDFLIDETTCFSIRTEKKKTKKEKPNIHMLIRFSHDFPIFEEAFLSWIDSLASKD